MMNIEQRAQTFVSIVKDLDPDILCLQEVTQKMYTFIKELNLKFTDYLSDHSYTTIIGIKDTINVEEIMRIPLKSSMGREALWCKTKDFDLVTFHLESAPINKELRKYQINQILSNELSDKLILCGDTNFIHSDETFGNGLVDYSPKEPSYDYTQNRRILGPYISHLDKIYTKGIVVKDSKLIKNDIVSDHFGIFTII